MDWRTENSAKNWATAYDFPAVRDKKVVLEEFPIRNFGVHAGLRLQHPARQVQGPARAPRLQFRLRFRGNEQADLLRPVQAHRQLFRGHRTGVVGTPRGQGAGNPANREGQGAGRSCSPSPIPIRSAATRRRCATICARRSSCCARPATRSRTPSSSTPRPASRYSVELLVRGAGLRARHAVLQAVAGAHRHHRLRCASIDTSQYENRLRQWDFDIIIASWGKSLSPGNEQRGFWGSQAADMPGSRNLVGIKNPAVDTLIERVIFTKDRDELVAATQRARPRAAVEFLRRAAMDLRQAAHRALGPLRPAGRPCRNTAIGVSRRSGGGTRTRRPRCRRSLDHAAATPWLLSARRDRRGEVGRPPRSRKTPSATACRPSAISPIRRISRISITSIRTRPKAACFPQIGRQPRLQPDRSSPSIRSMLHPQGRRGAGMELTFATLMVRSGDEPDAMYGLAARERAHFRRRADLPLHAAAARPNSTTARRSPRMTSSGR